MRKQLLGWLQRASDRVRRGGDWPQHFVRVGMRFSEACQIVHAARSDVPPWTDALIAAVLDAVFEAQGTDISLFATETKERFDAAHALGVVAASISTNNFDESKRKTYLAKLDAAASATGKKQDVGDDFGRKVVSFIFARQVLGQASLKRSPENNLNFAPADELHHDAVPADATAFARLFLDSIRAGEVVCTFLRPAEFRTQAALALAHCIDRFGDLRNEPPLRWRNGESLSAKEQLTRLRTIAGDHGIQTRVELSAR